MKNKHLLIRFFQQYVPQHSLTYIVGLLFLLATTWIVVTVPKVIGSLIDQLQQVGVVYSAVQPTLTKLALLAIALIICRTLSRVALFYPGRKVEQAIRQDFFNKLVFLPQPVYARYRIGDLMSRGVNDVTSVRIMLSMGILHSINTLFLGAGAIHGMASLSLPLTIWVFVPLVGLVTTVGVAVRFMFRYVRASQDSLGSLSESARETISAYALVNAYPIRDSLLERFDKVNQDYSQSVERVAALRSAIFPLMTTFISIGVLLVLWIGGRMVIDGRLALGSLVAFMTYVWILADPAIAIGWVMNGLQRGYSSLQRITEVSDQSRPDLWVPDQADTLELRSLSIQNLVFRYEQALDSTEPFELRIDQLELKAGQRLGIFGATGSGKSTLAQCLAGILPVTEGRLAFNGKDAAALSQEQWRRWVSFVPQQTLLFATSIEDNIRMAQASDAHRLKSVIEQSSLAADISGFPQGLRTIVGEGGLSLSGGQRQRVSLARALYDGGALLILDDMTSAVDLLTEADLLRRLFEHAENRLLIMISHRVNTLQSCDEILVLEQGRIVDRGTHEALVQSNGLYRGTWEYEQALLHQRKSE